MPERYTALRRMLHRLRVEFFPQQHPFDQILDVDTSGWISLSRLRIKSPNKFRGVHYQGVEPDLFELALRDSQIDPRQYTFIDLGCGKGRAMLLAHRAGFPRGIGVDFSPRLLEIAQKNLQRVEAYNFEVVCQDAVDFRFPDRPLYVFLYNPFDAEVLSKVLENLQKHTSDLVLAYIEPVHKRVFARQPSFKWLSTQSSYCVYRLEKPKSKSLSASA